MAETEWAVVVDGQTVRIRTLPVGLIDGICTECDVSPLALMAMPLACRPEATRRLLAGAAKKVGGPSVPADIPYDEMFNAFIEVPDDMPDAPGGEPDPTNGVDSSTPG